MSDYYILEEHDAKPVDLITWSKWFKGCDRHLADQKIGDSRISTVFLGIDHAFDGGSPVLFETMVFGGPQDGYIQRYSTWDAAMSGHNTIVKCIEGECHSDH